MHGGVDPEAEGESGLISLGVYSGRPAFHPYRTSLRLFKIILGNLLRNSFGEIS